MVGRKIDGQFGQKGRPQIRDDPVPEFVPDGRPGNIDWAEIFEMQDLSAVSGVVDGGGQIMGGSDVNPFRVRAPMPENVDTADFRQPGPNRVKREEPVIIAVFVVLPSDVCGVVKRGRGGVVSFPERHRGGRQ
jgi:hypothetical protein